MPSGLGRSEVYVWRCADEHHWGIGHTKELAYARWVLDVQFHRLTEGYFPAPL